MSDHRVNRVSVHRYTDKEHFSSKRLQPAYVGRSLGENSRYLCMCVLDYTSPETSFQTVNALNLIPHPLREGCILFRNNIAPKREG
jgi:hypothetical protein